MKVDGEGREGGTRVTETRRRETEHHRKTGGTFKLEHQQEQEEPAEENSQVERRGRE